MAYSEERLRRESPAEWTALMERTEPAPRPLREEEGMEPSPLVMKFGGEALETPEGLKTLAVLVRRQHDRGIPLVVVVSPVEGTAEQLRSAAVAAARGHRVFQAVRHQVQERHEQLLEATSGTVGRIFWPQMVQVLDNFEQLCRALTALGEVTPQALDRVASAASFLAIRLAAAALRTAGVPATPVEARECLITDGEFGRATPLLEASCRRSLSRLRPILEQGMVPVVGGGFGGTPDGAPTSLGRGGSAYTAAVLAACLRARALWLWKRQGCLYTADPSLVPEARVVADLSFPETAELGAFGARVPYPKSLLPAVEVGIPIELRDWTAPDGPFTRVHREALPSPRGVKALASLFGLSFLCVQGRGMMGVPGVAARAFQAVAEREVNVLTISQALSEQSLGFTVRRQDADRALEALRRAFAREMERRDVQEIDLVPEVAALALVGDGLQGHPEAVGHALLTLGREGIPIVSLSLGASERNLTVVVPESAVERALRALHRAFRLHE